MTVVCDCGHTWQAELHQGSGNVVFCPVCGRPVRVSLPSASVSQSSVPACPPTSQNLSSQCEQSTPPDSDSHEFHLAEETESKSSKVESTAGSSTVIEAASLPPKLEKKTPRQVVDTLDFSVNLSAKTPSIPIPSLKKTPKQLPKNGPEQEESDPIWPQEELAEIEFGLAEESDRPSKSNASQERGPKASGVRPGTSPSTGGGVPSVSFRPDVTSEVVGTPHPFATWTSSNTSPPPTSAAGEKPAIPPIPVGSGSVSNRSSASSAASSLSPPVLPSGHTTSLKFDTTKKKGNPNLSFLTAEGGDATPKFASKPAPILPDVTEQTPPAPPVLWSKRRRFFRNVDPVVLGTGALVGLFALAVLAYFIVPLCFPKQIVVEKEEVVSKPLAVAAKPSRDATQEKLEKLLADAELPMPTDWITNIRRYPENGSDIQQLIDELPERGILIISKGTQTTKPFVIRKPLRLIGDGNTFETSVLQGKDETTPLITVEMPLTRSAQELVENPSPSSEWITFQNLTISANGETAVHAVEGELRLVNCFVRQQSEAAHSAAICCDTQSFVSMDKCQFESGGEALYLKSSIGSQVDDCTIAGASCGVWFGSSQSQALTAATIRGLKISNVNLGIEFIGSPNGKVESVEIKEPRSAGIVIRAQDRDSADLVVQNCKMVLSEPDSRGIVCQSGNIDLRSVTVECGETRYGVEIQGGKAMKFEDLEVRGGNVGVFCGGRAGVQFMKCRFVGSLKDGALVQCAEAKYPDSIPQFSNCVFRDSRGAGIHLENGPVEFVDCTIEANLNAGVLVTNGRDATISRCQFLAQEGDAPGILVAAAKQSADPNVSVCEVTNSTFHDLKSHGIEVRDGTINVRKCTFDGGKTVGVMVCQDGAGVFEDCTIQQHTLAGVQVQDGGSPRFTRCQFIQNQTNGALVVKDRGSVCLFQTCHFDSNTLSGVEVRDSGGDSGEEAQAPSTESTENQVETSTRDMLQMVPPAEVPNTELNLAAPDATAPSATATSDDLTKIPAQGTLFIDCHIDHNGQSGVLCTGVGSRPEFRRCFIEGNQRAGVVACEDAMVLVRACTLADNEFGIWVYKKGGGRVRECLFERIRRHLYVIEKNAGILSRYGNQPSDE